MSKNEGNWPSILPRSAPKTKADIESRMAKFKKSLMYGLGETTGIGSDKIQSAVNAVYGGYEQVISLPLNIRYRAVQFLTLYWFFTVRKRNFSRGLQMFVASNYLICPEWFNSLFTFQIQDNSEKIEQIEDLVQQIVELENQTKK